MPNGIVLDGEILSRRDGVLNFGELQQRIGRTAAEDDSLDAIKSMLNAVP